MDTFIPRKVQGGMAGECAMENAVGMAAMVKADRLQMQVIARELSARLQTEVVVGGVEANMAIAGALTTPGCAAPLAILDLGAGSTDAAIVNAEGQITAVHLAGAGNMVSLLIKTELGLEDLSLAEAIKKVPAGQSGKPVQYSSREWRGGVLSGSPQPGGVRQSGVHQGGRTGADR